MNWFDVPAGVAERVIARTGVPHPHADLDAKRTALIVVDLQNAFMDDEVGHAVCPMARDIVPNVNRLASVVRGAGGGVFWVKNTVDELSAFEWSHAQAMLTPAARARRITAMSEGSKGQELWPDLDVRPEDEIVRKYRFSAFMPGTCELPVPPAFARLRYGADHRHRHQRLLRVVSARCDDDQLQDNHGERRQCGNDHGGAQRLASGVLCDLRGCNGYGVRYPAADTKRRISRSNRETVSLRVTRSNLEGIASHRPQRHGYSLQSVRHRFSHTTARPTIPVQEVRV